MELTVVPALRNVSLTMVAMHAREAVFIALAIGNETRIRRAIESTHVRYKDVTRIMTFCSGKVAGFADIKLPSVTIAI
jgi:predicted type IV restriction endonuclease